MEMLKANVQRGFNRLTRVQRDMINLHTLSLDSDWDCVLGQIFGRYATGMDVLFPEIPKYDCHWREQLGTEYGFFQSYGEPDAFTAYVVLHDEWVRLLSEERG